MQGLVSGKSIPLVSFPTATLTAGPILAKLPTEVNRLEGLHGTFVSLEDEPVNAGAVPLKNHHGIRLSAGLVPQYGPEIDKTVQWELYPCSPHPPGAGHATSIGVLTNSRRAD